MNVIRLLVLAAISSLLLMHTAYGQKIKTEAVPDEVQQALDFEYPNVKLLYWEMDKDVYVANFKEENSPGKCYINKNAQWIKTIYPVPRTELPSAITDYVKDNFTEYSITVSQLQEMPKVRIHYYIEARPEGVGEEASIITFNEVGSVIERTDPANFNKETKTVVQKATTPTKTQPNTNDKNKSASATSKSSSSTGKATASTSGSKSSSASTNPASSSSSSGKTSSTSTNKSSASSAGSKSSSTGKPAASSTTSKGNTSSSKTPSNATANKTTTSSSKTAATPEKQKKEKPVKPVYDELGNKAIDPNTVPAAVKSTFAKKIQHPEELNWFMIDSFYVAKCIAREQKNEVYIKKNGTWEKTYTELAETSVSGTPMKHIQTYYKGYHFKTAVRETRADKKDQLVVEIYEKANWKQKLVTSFLFDKSGKLLRSIDPNYSLDGQSEESQEDESLERYYKKMNMSNSSDNTGNIPQDIMKAFKAKYPNVTGVTWEETSDGSYQASYYGTRGKEFCIINSYGTITMTMTLGNPANLLSTIDTYIKQNYKGFKIAEYYAVKMILDKKNFYKVIIFNKKTSVEQEVWFTTSGKYVNM